MAYDAQRIIDLVNKGDGPNGMYSGSDKAAQLAALHKEIATDMLQLQGGMGEHWQGNAAGQAYAGAGPMVQASQVSGDHLSQAQNLYVGQGSSFNDLHGKVAAVGNLGTKPANDLVSDTPFSFMSNRADEIAAYNQKAQQVVDGYGLYHGQSTDNSGRWQAPSNYGALGMPPAGADIQPTTPGPGGGPGTGNPGGPGQGGGPGRGGSNTGYSGVGGGSHSGGSQSGDPGGSAGQRQGGPGAGGSVPVQSPVLGNGGTSTAGYTPPPSRSGGADGVGGQPGGGYNTGGGFGPGSGGFVPGVGGFGPGGGGFGPGGSSGSTGGGGRGSGGFSGGSGAGAGSAGSGSGAARPGGAAAAGAAGRSGAAGAGGMGHGGKGQGDEDTEHQRPAYLLEADPDDALVGELPRVSPPVIGL